MSKPSLFSLLLLTAFAGILAVLFTPAFPEIAKQLNISSGMTQMTMTLFLAGYALGTLPYGPLANRYGRKPTLLLGLLITLLGAILVALVPSFPSMTLFMIGRFLMGVGGCVGIKIATTMIGDVFTEKEARHITSYIVLSFAIVPPIAIFVGSILTQQFGWESCLYFLVVYCVFQLIFSFFLPETSSTLDHEALNWKHVGKKYLQQINNPPVLLSSLLLGFGTSFIYLFASEAPFIGIQYLGLSPELFGSYNFLPSLGMAAGSLATRFLAKKYDALKVLQWGALIAGLGSILMLCFFLKGHISIYTLFLPMPLIYLGLSMIFTNALPLGISHAKDKAAASAVLNCINMLVTVIVLGAMNGFSAHYLMIMPLVFTISSLILLSLQRKLLKVFRAH